MKELYRLGFYNVVVDCNSGVVKLIGFFYEKMFECFIGIIKNGVILLMR